MTAVRLILAALVLHLVLILPNHPGAMTPRALLLFPLELPVILLAMMALPSGRLSSVVRRVLVFALVLLAVLKLADFGMFTAFNRGFNPLVDLHLLVAGWRLSSGAVGPLFAALGLIAACAALAVVVLLVGWALRQWAGLGLPPAARGGAAAAMILAGTVAVAEIGQAMRVWALPVQPPGAAFTARVGVERIGMYRRTLTDLAAFHAASAADPFAGRDGLLDGLAGREVQVIFVESYGRASIDNPLYAPTHIATLERAQDDLARAGLVAMTGYLASPIEGGQSWLAHATLASGLSVWNQTRHGALLASPRLTLWQIARAAGYRTAAVMPAITLAWPEGARLGFDTVLDRDAMGYAGLPFNWVTMPDQFTLARFRDRLPPDTRPLFAQMALISSHAPWVPVPRMIAWDAVGDGRIFGEMTLGSDPPDVVWRDRDRVRDQYRQAVDYALQAVFAHAAREGARGTGSPLMIVLGDHPAAAFVAQTGGPDVPLHIIGPAEALAPLADWGLTPGLVPTPATPRWPMEAFRDRFLTAYSTPGDGT
jgi:hypothetical protein